jgi:hypothetical protein
VPSLLKDYPKGSVVVNGPVVAWLCLWAKINCGLKLWAKIKATAESSFLNHTVVIKCAMGNKAAFLILALTLHFNA